MIKLSDQAVGFLGTTLTVILSKIIYILILFIPFIVILIIKKKLDYHNDNKKRFVLIYVILIVISYGVYNLSLNLDKNRDLSLSEIYHDINNPDLSIPRLGCINVHASLLPRLRGGAPIQRAIMEGYKKTGITIMYMDEKMDSGDIISQKEIEITDTDTYESLHDKLAILGRDLLLDTLP